MQKHDSFGQVNLGPLMETSSQPSPARRAVVAALACLYAISYGTLVFLAIKLWRTYCEGFGCTGIGIAWFAWVVAYGVALAVGFVAHSLHRGACRLALGYGLASQLLAGMALFAYWAVKTAA